MKPLASLQLIVVTGKGGVGKSMIVAVLGRLLAASGRRVALIDVDPRESLHHLLDVPPSGGELVMVAPRLYLQHLVPRQILDDLVREKLRIGVIANRVLSSPVHQHFTEGAPGLKEAAVFGRALGMVQGHGPSNLPKPDIVILDGPATGHGVTWMMAPRLVSDVIQSGPVGHMAAEVAGFVANQDACGVIVVTTAEEMPVQETLELIDSLARDVGQRPIAVIVNALYPPYQEDPAAGTASDPYAELWRQRRQVNDRELERLAASWNEPLPMLPLLALEPGPTLVGALARQLAPQLIVS
jgi:anion-transporting  ArsA/GET3 family ATPase